MCNDLLLVLPPLWEVGAGRGLETLPNINVGSFLEELAPESIPRGHLGNAPHGLAPSLREGSKLDKMLLVQVGRMGLTCHLARWPVSRLELCATWVRSTALDPSSWVVPLQEAVLREWGGGGVGVQLGVGKFQTSPLCCVAQSILSNFVVLDI